MDEFYPGSRRKRRGVSRESKTQGHMEVHGLEFDLFAAPIIKVLAGVPTDMYTIGTLAAALDRPIATIRMWMSKGYFPSSPFRLKSAVVNGKVVPGRRLYTRPMIELAVSSFAERNLLNKSRIDWKQHTSLTIDLTAAWQLPR